MRALRAWFSRLIGFVRPGAGDRDFNDELQSHIDLHTDDNIRAGMTPDEARRQALARFGGLDSAKEAHRDRRGLPALGALLFDLKLGGRMLVKYPGLTIVGGLAMAFAICVGTVIVQVLSLVLYPTVPLPQGDRLVQIRIWDTEANAGEKKVLYDFNTWRATLKSVTEIGAWRDVSANLIVSEGDASPVMIAEITHGAFRVADATPLMGRVLTEADERADAPAVVVIGHEVWQKRFGSDPSVLGRTVQLGSEHVTVVGVMREGFKFPIAHDVWTPLRIANDLHAPRSGPPISVFALLAPGSTLDQAQAELAMVGQRIASEQPDTHAKLQPRVAPYALSDLGAQTDEVGIFASIYVFVVMLLVLMCSNVALLLFARAATRETEFTLRTALGASRRRIVAQLFAEALVLGGFAAIIGLTSAAIVLNNWGLPFLEVNLGRLPFWYDVSLSPTTVLVAVGLTIIGSGIAGVIPALKVTRGMGARLKQATAGAGGLQFGGFWTVVIVVQVAVTVAFPAIVYVEQGQLRHIRTFDAGFAAEKYLAVPLAAPSRAALTPTIETLRQRVIAEPGVAGVTFADWLPRVPDRPWERIELPEDVNLQSESQVRRPRRWADIGHIEPSYFEVLETPILAGRAFGAADQLPGANVAIVDQGFVEQVLQGRNPIGQQLRFRQDPNDPVVRPPNPWIEIVGVVKELGMGSPMDKERAAGLYLPATPDRFRQAFMIVNVRQDPLAFVPKVREIAAAVDPTLRLGNAMRLDQVLDEPLWFVGLWLNITIAMTAVALLLSLSGIYSVLSFIVARRRREIGIRVALGASRANVIVAICRRPLIQVGLGVVAGAALIALAATVETEMPGLNGDLSLTQFAIVIGYAIFMLGVCLLACIVPTRRALSVEPTVALRLD